MRPNPELYPDLAVAGSLAAALSAAANQQGLDLGGVRPAGKRESLLWASVPAERGIFSIGTGAVERWFLINAWSRGVQLIKGKCRDLEPVARAAHAWRCGDTLHDIRMVAPFVEFGDLEEAHERGPADAVAVQWRQLRERLQREDFGGPLIRLAVEAAYAQPTLRGLYPFTSHWSLHFTRCTGFPYSWDVPFVDPLGDGRYRICGPSRGIVIGEADTADEAIAMVVDHLPVPCGPAVAGTAEELSG